MKFYDRNRELSILREIRKTSESNAKFTVVTGRRRIGKTTLLLKAFEGETTLYFFVAKKAEKDLCKTFQEEIEEKLDIPTIGIASDFASVFEFLMKLSKQRHFTLIVDEFQDFLKVNPSVFSDIQRIWDIHSRDSKINFVVSGSINRMMSKIFRNKEEPLYNRHDHFLTLKPFTPSVIKEIISDFNPGFTKEDLLALYSVTGGVAKYIQILMENGAVTAEGIIDLVIREDSYFLDEGKALLLEEFGKDYGIYFSILTAVASGSTTRNEIDNAMGKEVGGYLSKLEDEYGLVSKNQPIFEKSGNKKVRYQVIDNFLSFWFRFIFKYSHILEIGGYEQLRRIVKRDYSVFSGKMLERYFKAALSEEGSQTRIGSWWDRKGLNEIDIVAENEIDKTAVFIEVKKNPEKYSEGMLLGKIEEFLRVTKMFGNYEITHRLLSPSDM